MLAKYFINPKTFDKLEISEFKKRVDRLSFNSQEFELLSNNFKLSDLIEINKTLQNKGYYNDIPKEFENRYKATLNQILNNSKSKYWTVNKGQELCGVEDLILLLGFPASKILSPKEVWNNSIFNFQTSSETILTAGAYVLDKFNEFEKSKNKNQFKYSWDSSTCGKILKNKLELDENYDIVISQSDLTPYEVIDPFGNSISISPKKKEVVRPYAGSESVLIRGLKQYVVQEGIDFNFKEFAEKFEKKNKFEIEISEDVLPLKNYGEIINVRDDVIKLTVFDNFYQMSRFGDFTNMYQIFITKDGNLGIFEPTIQDNSKLEKKIEFSPDDVSYLLDGILSFVSKNSRLNPKQIYNFLSDKI